MIATRHGNTTVKKGDKLAGTRIIPLVIKKDKLKKLLIYVRIKSLILSRLWSEKQQ